MKTNIFLLVFVIINSCAETKQKNTKLINLENKVEIIDSVLVVNYAKKITIEALKTNVYAFSSSDFEGRGVGQNGQKKASRFLKDFYKNEGLKGAINDTSYYQNIPAHFLPKNIGESENVLAYIKGSEKPDEVLIISGHFDHLGIENDEIHFGADDNASGSMAIIEIAKAFNAAKKEGHSPKRSILFLHLTAEEIGLKGSQYYVQNPVFALSKTIANLNIDMIGRVDKKHENNANYMYIIGANRISNELHFISEKTNTTFSNLVLDYTFNAENDKNRFYYRSDHYNFAKENIPVIFYFNGVHEDYHKPTDTPEKINFSLLEKRTRFIFATAWQLANKEQFLKHNN